MRTRKTLVVIILGVIFTLICIIFYKVEIKYLRPTIIPENYKNVILDSKIDFEEYTQSKEGKPLFIHFYNPECPCSRFNLDHFRTLIKKYSKTVNFLVVAQQNHTNTIQLITEQIGAEEGVQVLIDKNKTIATKMGVYSTPQAVILNKEGHLYYRGNYNKSRYCTDPRKYYAQQALDSLFENKGIPKFDQAATRSYGCGLDEEKDILDQLLL